jgi:CNT family concentrative nucleoside transporter
MIIQKIISFMGIFVLIFLAYLMSNKKKEISWKLVGIGVGLQLFFAIFILVTPIGKPFFDLFTVIFTKVMSFTSKGSELIFGSWNPEIGNRLTHTIAFGVLPSIIFFSSLMAVFYHLGVMQKVVNGVAWAMQKTMKTSGSETLSAAANIFVGQTEAPLMVKPFVKGMTQSELMAVMVGGFATIAGGVMAMYISFLSPYFPNIAGHLMAASVMSAPAALVIAKIIYPETEKSETAGDTKIDIKSTDANVIDAAARGAGEGLMLALNVGAMLLAFVALVALINYVIALPSYFQHHLALTNLWDQISADDKIKWSACQPATLAWDQSLACVQQITTATQKTIYTFPTFSLELILSYLFAPIAMVIGIPPSESLAVGQLLGTKIVLNEMIAYQQMLGMIKANLLTERSILITSYALCGFANFSSIAIQIGGIGGLAPERRSDLAKLGLKAMLGGTLAALMTGTIAGILI